MVETKNSKLNANPTLRATLTSRSVSGTESLHTRPKNLNRTREDNHQKLKQKPPIEMMFNLESAASYKDRTVRPRAQKGSDSPVQPTGD